MWGGGWGNHAPETARTVAKAFHEGRACKRGNCRTDGMHYWLENTCIASRENTALEMAFMLENGRSMHNPHRGATVYSFGGWSTKMTARHLCALGVDAYCSGIKKPKLTLSGKPCRSNHWYSLEDIELLPPEPPPEPKKPRTQFVNITLPLFAT